MATTAEHGSLMVVSSNLTSTMKSLLKEKVSALMSHVKNLKILLDPQKLEPCVGVTASTRMSGPFQGGRRVL